MEGLRLVERIGVVEGVEGVAGLGELIGVQ